MNVNSEFSPALADESNAAHSPLEKYPEKFNRLFLSRGIQRLDALFQTPA
jgi:hypothetical protein